MAGTAWVGASALLISGLAAVPTASASTAARITLGLTASASPGADVLSRPDAVSAALAARVVGHRVADVSESTPYTTVYANPDGTWTETTAPVPIQAQRGDGSWAAIDTSLTTAKDGSLVPVNAPDQLVFSSGGDTTAASMMLGGKKTSWLWPTALPAPTVSGATATYRVSETERLELTATPTGFSEDVVLTAPPSDPAAAVYTLPIQTGAETSVATAPTPTGDPDSPAADTTGPSSSQATPEAAAPGLVLKDAQGRPALWASAPVAYDATGQGASAASGKHVSALKVRLTRPGAKRTDVELTPDWGWLHAASTKYPVRIDPTFATTSDGDTWVDSGNPTVNRNGLTYLHVGDDAGATVARTFMKFSRGVMSGLSGEHVTSAVLSLRNTVSHSCTAATINAQRITADWTAGSITWNNQPTVAGTTYGFSPAYGYDASCPAGTATWDVTGIVDGWARSGYANYGIRLSANTETNVNSFRNYKAYESGDTANVPTLTITWNRPPATPTQPKVTPVTTFTPYGSTTGSLYTAVGTPKVSATVSDPDGGTVKATFNFYTSKTGSIIASCTSPMVASGTTASCAPATKLPNSLYYIQAVANDGHDDSVSKSAWTQVTVASGNAATPTISCTGQSNGAWAATKPSTAVPCTIAINGAGLIAPGKATYTLDGVTKTLTFAQPSSGSPRLINLTVPASNGGHSITAVAYTPAGTSSATATMAFGYGTLGLSSPAAPTTNAAAVPTTSGTVAIQADGPGQASGAPHAYLQWRLAGSGLSASTGWSTGSDLTATTNANGGLSFTGVWDSTDATHDTGTNTDLDPRLPQLLEIQVCADYTAGTECTWGTNAGIGGHAGAVPNQILRVAHAFGDDFPTTSVVGGQAALWTGEWQTSATDATLAAGSTALSVDRTASSFAGPSVDPAGNVFGPGWTANLDGPSSGYAGEQVIDATRTQGVLAVLDSSGNAMVFAPSSSGTTTGTANPIRRTGANLKTGTWLPMDADTLQAGVVAAIAGTGAAATLTLTDPDGTQTIFTLQSAPTSSTNAVFHTASVTEAGDASATSYAYDSTGRVTRILAPVPSGVTCPGLSGDDALPAGCRAIALRYATATTATGSAPGDYTGQVSSIDLLVGTGTGAGASTHTTTVAAYAYDTTGRLTTVTDPRDHLATGYGYTAGPNENLPVLASITPPGQTPIHYAYDTTGKLTQITRQRDTTDSPAGTADLATIAYNLPAADLAGSTATTVGLPDVSTTAVAAWAQDTGPTYAAAVFGPDHNLTLGANGDLDPTPLSANDWTYAWLSYADSEGRQTNTARYGAGRWLLTDTEYDTLGSTVRGLSTSDIAAIQDGTLDPEDAGSLTVYNTEIDGTPDANGNPTVLLPADTEATDSYQTARWVQLADGSLAWVRPHTHTTYDQSAPNSGINPATGQNYALATTVTTGAADPDTVDTSAGATEVADLQVDSISKTGYANAVPVGTGHGATTDANAGWDQGLASSTTTVMNDTVSGGTAGAAPITSTTVYDATGDVIATNQPATVASINNGGSADAGTRQSIYYTAGATSAVGTGTSSTPDIAACDNHPELDGLLCQTRFAGNPSAGPAMITTTYHYNDLDDPTSTVEASGVTTRTTSTGYDAAERITSSITTVTGLASSTPVPATSYGYDPNTGLQTTVTTGIDTASTIATRYDAWGRRHTYTTPTAGGAAGGTTSTTYDTAGDQASLITPDGVTTTYTYDGGTTGPNAGKDATGQVERRGLPTAITATATSGPNAGATITATGAYDAAGNLIEQSLPGGVSITDTYDTAGELTDRTYAGDVTTTDDTGNGTTTPNQGWIGWSQTHDAEGRILASWTPDGAALSGDTTGAAATGYADAYTYDPDGRLTQVTDQTQATGAGGYNDDGTPTEATATGSCVIRQYGFDLDGNRTSKATIPAKADGSCQSTNPTSDTGVTTTTTGYDPAHSDRVTTTGYVYDNLGRITTIPQTDTPEASAVTAPGDLALGYYDTDMVQTATQAGQTTTYALDPAGRVATQTTGPTGGAVTRTVAMGYADGSDRPGWESTSSASPSTETYVSGLGGDLLATLTSVGGTPSAQLAVTDPHADVVSQITLPSTGDADGLDDWSTTDEYGNPTGAVGTTATNPSGSAAIDGYDGLGYGWLGGDARATLDAGLTLMGARLYNSATGQFTSLDPIYGGNSSSYGYPTDPVNQSDTSGLADYCYLVNTNSCPEGWVSIKEISEVGPVWYNANSLTSFYGVTRADADAANAFLAFVYSYATVDHYMAGYKVYNLLQRRWIHIRGYKYVAVYRIKARTVITLYARMRVYLTSLEFWVRLLPNIGLNKFAYLGENIPAYLR